MIQQVSFSARMETFFDRLMVVIGFDSCLNCLECSTASRRGLNERYFDDCAIEKFNLATSCRLNERVKEEKLSRRGLANES
jgi:hypothetical protein